ncbi:MAG: glutamine amidotransferase [Solirubrobacterales bacterium]|nr:glutamine amidotransferase [Solirubrobacterales bacterium]
MCGIAGIIHKDGPSSIGREMTRMLQSMKHRGPDSTGYALYGPPSEDYVMRIKLADAHAGHDYEYAQRLRRNRSEIERRVGALGATIRAGDVRTKGAANGSTDVHDLPYAMDIRFAYDGDLKDLTDRVEDVKGTEVISLGHSLEIIKDLGDAETVAADYHLSGLQGTHAIGHVRMATESDVDISGAHPYWAYPFSDVAVVHNGQLTNYHYWTRRLEREGHRFQSENDSEVIAVYIAQRMSEGSSLEEAMNQSLEDLDGVFTYICVTEDSLGMAKDELAAKPLVLYESDGIVAMASEEIALHAVLDDDIETYDPFESEVMVWQR